MIKNTPVALLRLAALCAIAMPPALASVDTSPAPGGVYRLKPGIYVAAGAECSAPANPSIRMYDGKGISTAHTRACKATVRSRKRDVYTVRQTCIDAGAGPAPRFTETQTVKVRDALSFSQTIGRRTATYRYCPVYALPPGLREHAP